MYNKFSNQLFLQLTFISIQFILYISCFFYYFNNLLFFFSTFLPDILINNFIFTNIIDFLYLKTFVIISCSFISIIPVLIINIYIFILPSLYIFEKKNSMYLLLIYICYNVVCVYILINCCLKTIITSLVITDTLAYSYTITFEPRIDLYIYTILKILYIYIILINSLFIFSIFINLQIISFSNIIRYRKLIILFLGIISILITPPDFYTFIYIYIPLTLILELVILYNLIKKILYSF